MKTVLYEKDILFKTENITEPGSVHIKVYPPEQTGYIPIVIEQKSVHNPLSYIEEIVFLLQSDIFDRMQIDIKRRGIIYFKKAQHSVFFHVKLTGDGTYQIEEQQQIDF